MFRNIFNAEVIDMVRDAELQVAQIRRPFHARDDPFDLSDRQFMGKYRLSKAMVDDLINIVEERSVAPSRSSALDFSVKVKFVLLHGTLFICHIIILTDTREKYVTFLHH